MITVRNWENMSQFGIVYLTGEADHLHQRFLCDLTDDGLRLIQDYFRIPFSHSFSKNVNNTGVASMLLPYSILQELAMFAMFQSGYDAVVIDPSCVTGIKASDEAFGRIGEVLAENPQMKLYRKQD